MASEREQRAQTLPLLPPPWLAARAYRRKRRRTLRETFKDDDDERWVGSCHVFHCVLHIPSGLCFVKRSDVILRSVLNRTGIAFVDQAIRPTPSRTECERRVPKKRAKRADSADAHVKTVRRRSIISAERRLKLRTRPAGNGMCDIARMLIMRAMMMVIPPACHNVVYSERRV